MEHRENRKKARLNNRTLLLAVLVGFCLLALIEIVYGQKQIKMEAQRIAMEEENKQTIQQLQEEMAQMKLPEAAPQGEEPVTEQTTETTENANTAQSAENQTVTESGAISVGTSDTYDAQHDMQIVMLGDSILDGERGTGGVASLISMACNAKVYNMAMGGTTAAMLEGDSCEYDNWTSRSMLGVVNAIVGNIDGSIFEGYKAGEVLKECDFSKTDYFILEYGINDFLTQKIPQSIYLEDGTTRNINRLCTYTGALTTAVDMLRNNFPNAKIMIIAPHYCQFFQGDTFIGDGYSVDYGYGNLIAFSRAAGYVYDTNKENNVLFYNAFEDSGINAETADKYLEDGIHLTAEGRRVYAETAARLINADFRKQE